MLVYNYITFFSGLILNWKILSISFSIYVYTITPWVYVCTGLDNYTSSTLMYWLVQQRPALLDYLCVCLLKNSNQTVQIQTRKHMLQHGISFRSWHRKMDIQTLVDIGEQHIPRPASIADGKLNQFQTFLMIYKYYLC